MKQVLQNIRTGETRIEDVPAPRPGPGQLLIRSSCSLVSTGTEKMLVEFGKAGLLQKARQQPDKVRMVLEKIKTDGLLPTLEAVYNKLDQPMTMGYCNVGRVLAVGEGVTGFNIGDRVASNGRHAEVIAVPKNLCAKIPEAVSDEAAAFTVIGAIALQGIRLAQPTLGETVAVTGLGLIGLMTVQLLRAAGCRVLGLDFDAKRLALAHEFGAEIFNPGEGDPVEAALRYTHGRGIDAVLITAATSSNEPVHQAARMSRKRGRIVLVGVTGLQLARADFYEKELTFQVSCSYGPGRYDPFYEDKGQDYPLGFVRWTEQRNFEAVLDMLQEGRLQTRSLVTQRYAIGDAEAAYELISSGEPALGVLLQYPSTAPEAELLKSTITLPAGGTVANSTSTSRKLNPIRTESDTGKKIRAQATVGFIGAGNYASRILIPAFQKAGAKLNTIASTSGVTSAHAGRKFGFARITTDSGSLIDSDAIDTVVIASRHDSHARLVCQALQAGKNVFVEKPLALNYAELEQVRQTYKAAAISHAHAPKLMVGFNRRFAPQTLRIKSLLQAAAGPKSFIMTINAGTVPADHWTQNRKIGGGRIIGEACHFIDLLRFLAGEPVTAAYAECMGPSHEGAIRDDKATILLKFADGSLGNIHYYANGHKALPKERLEIFAAGKVLQLDNFRGLQGHGWQGFNKFNLWKQDKGGFACVSAFMQALAADAESPIPFGELVEVARVTLDIDAMLNSHEQQNQ